MARFKVASRLVSVLALATVMVLAVEAMCLADESRLTSKEPWAATDHIVQDTIGRGLDFVLKPAYVGVSQVYFFVYKPPVMRHITIIRTEEPPAEQQPQEQQSEEQPQPMQEQPLEKQPLEEQQPQSQE